MKIVYKINMHCHCEPVLTLAWQSPKHFNSLRGSPHQSADWFAMT